MKARVIATGEIVEAIRICQSSQGPIWKAGGRDYYEYELDFDVQESIKSQYDPDYWTRLEHQYAGMVLLGLSTRGAYGKEETIADYCYDTAHALVEKMKEERKK